MMFHRLGLINRNQKGFTLIELIIAIAISSVITGAATMTISQVFSGSARSSNHMIAVRQVQNAGYWVSHDTQMAQSVEPTADSDGFPLTLTWTDWDSGLEYQVVYSLEDMSGGLKNLQRSYSIDGINQGSIFVAQYIDPDETNCEFTAGGAFSLPDGDVAVDVFTITDDVGGDSGTITVTTGRTTATPTGNAIVDGVSFPDTVVIDAGSTVTWSTPAANDAIEVAATAASTSGDWTSTAGIATAAITTDDNENATLADGGMLIFTVTATVGTGSQETSETRVYEVTPRPN